MPEQIKSEQVVIQTAVPTDKLKHNVINAGNYCLSPIDTLLGQRREGAIALVGGGPSLAKTIGMLKYYKNIIVCGSAHDYFVNNLTWTYAHNIFCIICDPDPIMVRYIHYKSQFVTYLIASQCDETMFKHLEDMPKKHIWHCSSGTEFDTSVYKEGEKLIIGGCTVGTRAIGMAMAMGYKKVDLFGFDSCLTNQYRHHAYDFVDPDVETLGDIRDITIGENSPTFKMAGYMIAQLFDFQNILHNYADKLDIQVFGGGALARVMECAEEKFKQLKEERKNGTIN